MRRARVVSVTCLLSTALAAGAPAAMGQSAGCERYDAFGNCIVEVPVEIPGTPTGDTPGQGDTGGGSGPTDVPACVWRNTSTPPSETVALYPGAPADAIWQYLDCGPASENQPTGFRWVAPDGTPSAPAPVPAAVAQTVMARVEAQMRAPRLEADPARGVAAIVDVPTFVAVSNWQGEIVEGPECVFGVCVTITATPTLTFDPGDGSPAITCPPGGSRYQADGPSAAAQAQGACAYAYPRRTGVEDRPAEWPGVVTVTWDVSWSSATGGPGGPAGPGGTFDPLTFSADLPRAVDEVATVVVAGET